MHSGCSAEAGRRYNDIIPSRSLLPVLRGEQERVRDFCFSESDFTEERIDGVSITSTPYWRGADGCRSNAWQTIITENSKYIKYLGYKLDEMPYEEFYDLKRDPQERENRIADETYREQIEQARRRLSYMVDHYPSARKRGQLPVRQIVRRRRTKGVIRCRVFVFW